MIPVRHIFSRVPMANGSFIQSDDDAQVFIDPDLVDTITCVSPRRRAEQSIPDVVNSIIRYRDHQVGYRLFYIANLASHVASMIQAVKRGENPGDVPEIPHGV